MSEKPSENERLIASNKKVFHDYFVLDRYEGGLVLTGTEVKSLREGKANLKDSYVTFKNGEAFLFNAHISPYTHGNRENHDPLRTRKLLLHRREVEKLASQVAEKGLSVVPLRLYFKKGYVKVEIATVKGKRQYDKRETEKKKEADREREAVMKYSKG